MSVSELVDDLEHELQEQQETTTLADIADAIEDRRIKETKTLLASDEEDKKAVDKFFYHYKGRRNRKTSTAEVVFKSVNYILVRSEMHSSKKANYDDNDDGTYHAGWVIGVDPDQDSGFFIHRLNHTQKLEDPDYDWTEQEIKQRMGVDADWQGGDMQAGKWYRVQGDIRLKKCDYRTVDDLKEKKAGTGTWGGRKQKLMRQRKQEVAAEYEEEIIGDAPVKLVRLESRNFDPEIRLNIDLPEDTDQLKERQDELGINEDAVRDFQDNRDSWNILTAERRKQAVKALLLREPRQRMQDLFDQEIDEDALEEQALNEIEQEWDEEEGQLNIQRGNHVLIFENAIDEGRNPGDQVIVREECKLFVIHDEHRNKQLTLDRGIYAVDQLNRHERN